MRDGLELQLGGAGDCRLDGRVVDGGGVPLVGVEVTAVAAATGAKSVAATTAGGSFTLLGLPPGDLEVRASLPGHSLRGAPVLASCPGHLDLEMIALGSLRGVVVDSRRLPVQDFEVRALVPSPVEPSTTAMSTVLRWMAVRSADGAFRYPLAGDGEQVVGLLVRAEGVSLASKTFPAIDVHADTDTGTLVLSRPGAIRGRVVDGEGHGIAGVRLTIRQEAEWGAPVRESTTDDTGSFTLQPALADDGVILAVHPDWIEERVAVTVEEDRDLLGVQITLQPGAELSGFVSDSSGRPVPGARILVTALGPEAESFAKRKVTSNANGRYRFAGLAPGSYVVRARLADSPRYGPERTVNVDSSAAQHQDLEVAR